MSISQKERFLEQAIETATEEILEELSCLKERGIFEKEHDIISRTIRDLLHSSKYFEVLDIEKEDEVIEEEEEVIPSYPNDSRCKYKVNERVTIHSPYFGLSADGRYARELFPEFSLSELKDSDLGKKAIIIANKYAFDDDFYIIEIEEGKRCLALRRTFRQY